MTKLNFRKLKHSELDLSSNTAIQFRKILSERERKDIERIFDKKIQRETDRTRE